MRKRVKDVIARMDFFDKRERAKAKREFLLERNLKYLQPTRPL